VFLKAEFADASTCQHGCLVDSGSRRIGVSVLRDFTNSRRTR
jgi:hypothetical protein